jgi:anionic cell wall polymer biosynthesis LytR-Cps2A-Psr (LCP) family protein
MPVVKELVDQIGGLTYTLDFNYSMAGRQYTAGEQFMDGQAVLDYLRVRRIYPRSI